MHRVHVDLAWKFLISISSTGVLILLLNVFVRIASYLSSNVREIRNAYVTLLTRVNVLEHGNENLYLLTSAFPNRFH